MRDYSCMFPIYEIEKFVSDSTQISLSKNTHSDKINTNSMEIITQSFRIKIKNTRRPIVSLTQIRLNISELIEVSVYPQSTNERWRRAFFSLPKLSCYILSSVLKKKRTRVYSRRHIGALETKYALQMLTLLSRKSTIPQKGTKTVEGWKTRENTSKVCGVNFRAMETKNVELFSFSDGALPNCSAFH